MAPGATCDGDSRVFSADCWTVTEQKRRPLPAASRSLTRSASTGFALRSSGRQSSSLQSVGLRQRTPTASAKAAGVTLPSVPYLAPCASQPSLPRPAREEPLKRLSVGQAVCIHGLAKTPELNGATAVCEEWDNDSGRWRVCLQGLESRTIAVKPANLTLAPAREQGLREDERCKLRCANLAVPRRRKLVEQTMEVVRGAFDPAEGLAEAAAAAAREVLSRTEECQREKSSSLAQPRLPSEVAFEEQLNANHEKLNAMLRSRTEQQERCEELARPRAAPSPLSAAAEGVPEQAAARSVPEQRKHCAQLAQPRLPAGDLPDDCDQYRPLNAAWQSLLAARNGPSPQGLADARAWLASRPTYFGAASDLGKASATSAPSSPKRCDSAKPVADPVAVRELKEVVEELLWMVLLQLRCCPKPEATNSKVLEERLCSLLLSSVGPALRPVARRVLGPGTGVVRRVRTEFPRLSLHLGFRDSEDSEPAPVTWSAEEISMRANEIRACRDQLLDTDLTKALMTRLGQ